MRWLLGSGEQQPWSGWSQGASPSAENGHHLALTAGVRELLSILMVLFSILFYRLLPITQMPPSLLPPRRELLGASAFNRWLLSCTWKCSFTVIGSLFWECNWNPDGYDLRKQNVAKLCRNINLLHSRAALSLGESGGICHPHFNSLTISQMVESQGTFEDF